MLRGSRGGGELGPRWYKDGRLEKKVNTFEDFIAVAIGLIDDRYTSPALLAAKGVSAGGMACGTSRCRVRE